MYIHVYTYICCGRRDQACAHASSSCKRAVLVLVCVACALRVRCVCVAYQDMRAVRGSV